MKRITLFCGHYGSGKTSIAISYAKHIKKSGLDTSVIDLDIVNPYFRTKDSEKELNDLGISIVASEYESTNLDAPALPKEIYPAISNKNLHLVIDVGGDDRGAVALGRYAEDITADGDYEMLFVASCYRPLTKTPEDALQIMREIEAASKIRFTGIVNNSNIGNETTKESILSSLKFAEDLSRISGLPIVMTTATKGLYDKIKNDIPNAFCIDLQDKYYEIN